MEGLKDLQRDIERLKREAPKELKTFINKQGLKLVKLTKKETPVDMGVLRAGWQSKNSADPKVYKTEVYNLTDYAEFVEYGTRHKTGRYMLTKSTSKIEAEFNKDLEILVGRLLK